MGRSYGWPGWRGYTECLVVRTGTRQQRTAAGPVPRLVDVQENELRYIAQELHDEVGQAITSLMLGLQLIQKEADKPEVIRAESVRLDQVVDNVMENLHAWRRTYALSVWTAWVGGCAAPAHRTLREKLSLEIQFEMIRIDERLPADMEIALYRIVQEALNNVVRHARATQVDVLIHTRTAVGINH